MMKRIVCMLLVLLMMVSTFSACKKNPSKTEYVYSTYVEEDDDDGVEIEDGADADNGTKQGKTVKKKKSSTTKSKGQKVMPTVNNGSILEGLDFGGKTFTKTIIGTVGGNVTRAIAAFGEQYNCKIKLVKLKWETYNSQVAARMASGNPYDICGIANQFFPECCVQGLYEPLDKYIKDVDKYNPKTGYGIDMDLSSYYNYQGKMYGLCAHTGRLSSQPMVLYYNKLKFKEAGLPDPLELYNKGQWTWDEFIKLGKDIKDDINGKYIIGQDIDDSWVLSNDWNPVKFANGKTVANLSDPKLINALAKYTDICKEVVGPKSFSDNPSEFINGNYYMFMQNSEYGYLNLIPKILSSSAFKKDKNNLGICPVPIGPDNKTNASPCACGQGKAAGKGSKDPRVVVAWVLFSNMFIDPEKVNDKYAYNDEQQGIINKLCDNVIPHMNAYKTATQNAAGLVNDILKAARNGGDYTSAIEANKNTIQAIINDSMKQ